MRRHGGGGSVDGVLTGAGRSGGRTTCCGGDGGGVGGLGVVVTPVARLYTDMLGCSISKFSSGDVSTVTGPVEVKHGGGVTNHDSSTTESNEEDRL